MTLDFEGDVRRVRRRLSTEISATTDSVRARRRRWRLRRRRRWHRFAPVDVDDDDVTFGLTTLTTVMSVLGGEVGDEEGQLSAEMSTTATSGFGHNVGNVNVSHRLRSMTVKSTLAEKVGNDVQKCLSSALGGDVRSESGRRRWRRFSTEDVAENDVTVRDKK